ncbi:tetratricopeptide repeat protein, partial [Deinococcus sp. 6GRE01]|uniref:tetratricopeptide repeat protein n=1 Tax=Deinococcus sp. 6GRE01 TaxID=2745873 RepID=UPI001E44D76E
LSELAVPHAWALIGVGRYQDALTRLNTLSAHDQQVSDALAARAVTLIRLGRTDEAVTLADRISGSGPDAAHAASVRAHAARMREQWEEARRYSQLAADLWNLHGDDEAHLTELGMVARAQVGLGAEPQVAFEGVLRRSHDLPSVHGMILVNYAAALGDRGDTAQAETELHRAVEQLTLAGDRQGLATVHGNLGVRCHLAGQLREAIDHYRRALDLLSGSGHVRLLGLTLSNLSEIDGDLSAFEDALMLLEHAGQVELVKQIRHNAQLVSAP